MSETVSSLGSIVHLQIVRGTDQPFIFSLKGKSSDAEVFTPTDLSSSSVMLTVRTSLGGTVLFTKTNTLDQHEDAVNGKTRFVIRRSDLSTLPVKDLVTLVYELRLVTGDVVPLHHVHASGNLLVKLTAQPTSLA